MKTEMYPASFAQRRLWLLHHFEEESTAYNLIDAIIVNEFLNIQVLQETINYSYQRHESFRTSFLEQDTVLYQKTSEKITPLFFTEDFSFLNEEEQEHQAKSFFDKTAAHHFDLSHPPLACVGIAKLADDKHLIILNVHHIISDGWSQRLFFEEIFYIYDSLYHKKEILLPELKASYKDYAVENNRLIEVKGDTLKEYWINKLKTKPSLLELPFDRKRKSIQSFNGKRLVFLLDMETENGVKELLKRYKFGTSYSFYLSVLKILLYKLSGQKDIVVGAPVFGRNDSKYYNTIGFFANTVVFRTLIDSEEGFEAFHKKVYKDLMYSIAHQDYPFDLLVEELYADRGVGSSPVFNVMLAYNNTESINTAVEGFQISDYKYALEYNASIFDLVFYLNDAENGKLLTIEYNTDLFDKESIYKISEYYTRLIQSVLLNYKIVIKELEILSKHEIQRLLVEFNATEAAYPKGKTIIDLFEEQAAKTPDAVAVVYDETRLTYSALNESANQLAGYLREKYDIHPDDLLGIKLDRSEKIAITILGILKSGAAYVPIDINYPEERIAYIEKDSNSKVVLDEEALYQFSQVQEKYPKENLKKINTPEDLAYIIYTSGTTGNPKGVMIAQKNAVELLHWCHKEFDSSKFEVVYAATSYCFDLSVYELFYALSIGKKVRILNNPLAINDTIGKDNKVVLNTVPSVIRALVEEKAAMETVSLINMAGEVIPVDLVNKLPLERIEVRNLYGPSEDTTYSTSYKIENRPYTTIPIGKPISNTQVYILDEDLQVVPIGVAGKLYISGAGVARGYLNKTELTQEKFIENPFRAGERMYDTGDLGRWLPDGNIEFLGRKDHQVKLRGYRIELGEIENKIVHYSTAIKQAVVEAKEIHQEKALVAYLVADETIDKSELRSYLQDKLPEYMVPSYYVVLEALPLSPNGKIDRRALPNISDEDIIRKEYIAPRNEIEEKLATLWQEVLGLEKIGVKDNFLELGGHSLEATKLLILLRKEFEVKISLQELYTNLLLEEQANMILNIYMANGKVFNVEDEDTADMETFSI